MILKQKTLTLVLALTFLVCNAGKINALEISEKGFKTGINFANSTGEFVSDPKYKTGFVGGIFLTNEITHRFSLQTELFYTMKGYLVKTSNWDTKATFTYLQLPILLKINLHNTGELKLNVLTGPSFNYNLSAKYDSKFYDESEKGDMDLNNFDLGANLGFSLHKKVSENRSMILDLRYEYGLLNWDGDEHNDKNFNRSFNILFGVSI